MLRYLPFLLVLAVWIFAFIDCLNTPEKEIRKLPKVAWVIIILLFGQVLLGPIAWFAVGRPRRNAPYGATRPQERRWVAPDDNPEFLKSINESKRSPRKDEDDGGELKDGGDDARTSAEGTDGTAATGPGGANGNGSSDGTGDTGAKGEGARPDAARQEAELRRREEESQRRRENGADGTDDAPPQGR